MTATAALLPVLLLLLAFGRSAHGAECFPACHPENGFCDDDSVCRCQPGWQGPLCDQCVTFPGCVNGLCVEPWQCICKDGWDGHLCDLGGHLPLPGPPPAIPSPPSRVAAPPLPLPAHPAVWMVMICLF
uniref:Delta like non-canonical Notch ligand 1 n=1 Tax=Moschus moschiferus TaxID=68415 RepID=A0A8C6CXP8_MOSMO